ncbi:MAG TPA: hypothetical protein VFP37_06620 [Steroidobacteraceae bacterium]|nr:hypothetical protein [Steroidobacteraceae bacterium]
MTSFMWRVLGGTLLAALMSGCANTPRGAMGIPWWPQGPGDPPEEARCAEPATATPCRVPDASHPGHGQEDSP